MAAKKKITKRRIPTPVDESREERRLSVAWTGTILIVLTIAMIGLGMADLEAMTERSIRPGWNWVAVLILMFAFVVVLGVGLNGRLLGILINERMLMSLSRFQMVIWTLLVLSAYFVIALVRIRHPEVANPLEVAIPWEVWSLVGISTASLVGTPFIYGFQKHKKPVNREDVFKKAGKALNVKPDYIEKNKQGILYGNEHPSEAAFTDMFEGDEVQNAAYIDVGKLQMFFFTVIVAVTFAAQVFQLISSADLTAEGIALPTVHEGLLTLMGISNAGYLANKGVDHTKAKPART